MTAPSKPTTSLRTTKDAYLSSPLSKNKLQKITPTASTWLILRIWTLSRFKTPPAISLSSTKQMNAIRTHKSPHHPNKSNSSKAQSGSMSSTPKVPFFLSRVHHAPLTVAQRSLPNVQPQLQVSQANQHHPGHEKNLHWPLNFPIRQITLWGKSFLPSAWPHVFYSRTLNELHLWKVLCFHGVWRSLCAPLQILQLVDLLDS